MKNIYSYIKKYLFIGVLALLVVFYFIFSGNHNKTEFYVVKSQNIEQSVLLSGKVEIANKADLGFAASGRVAKIFVENNQSVISGNILAQLEIGDLLADLQIKQANSKTSDVDLEAAKVELEKITKQENTKVSNAYRSLLSLGLVLTGEDTSYDLEAPIVTGIYDGPEGQYKVLIDKENIIFDDFRLSTFNLEKTTSTINETSTTALGSRGLYVAFPVSDLSPYLNTVWYLNIPNKSSSVYLSNLNAYNTARDTRDLEINNAESEYLKLLTKGDDGSSIAQAEINKIQAEIRKNTIYAPFNGRVTNIEKEVGENASIGESVVTVLGEDKLEVVFQVSELDISRLVTGATIDVTLDAMPGENFEGILKTVNSKETEIDGVPVYEAFVDLSPDPRIKNGMSAKGSIVLFSKQNVLAVPTYLIKKVGSSNFVKVVLDSGKLVDREVSLGLVGTDSMVEVISGLEDGEKLDIYPNEK